MQSRIIVLSIAFLLLCSPLRAQKRLYSVSLSGSFTASSKLFYFPTDPDFFNRQLHLSLENVFGFGIDVRGTIEETGLQIGLGTEYLSKREQFTLPRSFDKVTDGFIAVPVELTGYFTIPFSSEEIQLYMGGGGGIYFGSRIYEYNNIRAFTIERTPGYGIHVLSGIQYNFHPSMALRGEMKFRDVQFTVTNAFPPHFNSGTSVQDTSPFKSRISIDGMNLTLGIVAKF